MLDVDGDGGACSIMFGFDDLYMFIYWWKLHKDTPRTHYIFVKKLPITPFSVTVHIIEGVTWDAAEFKKMFSQITLNTLSFSMYVRIIYSYVC